MQEDFDCVKRKIIQIDQLFQEYLKKCNKLKSLVKTTNLLSQDRERLVLENNHQKFTLETLQKSYDELEIKHQDMTAQLSNLEQKYNQTLTDSQSHTRDLEDELRMLKELTEASKSPSPKKINQNLDKNIAKNSEDELMDCKMNTKQKKNAYTKEITQLKVQLNDLNELVSTLRAEKEEFLHEIPKLRNQIKIAEQSCRNKDNEIKTLRMNVFDCNNHMKNLKQTNEELQNVINKQKAIARLKSTISISTQTDDTIHPNPDLDLDEKVKNILREMLNHPPLLTPFRTDSPKIVLNNKEPVADKSIQIEDTCDVNIQRDTCNINIQRDNTCDANIQREDTCEVNIQREDTCAVNIQQQDACDVNIQTEDTCDVNIQRDTCNINIQRDNTCDVNLQREDACDVNNQREDTCDVNNQREDTCDVNIQTEDTCDVNITCDVTIQTEDTFDVNIQRDDACDINESLPLPPIQKTVIKKKQLKRRILKPKRRDTLLEALKVLQKSKINFSICDSNSKLHIEQTNCDRIGGKLSTVPNESNRETIKNNVLDKITDLVFEKLNRSTRSNSPYASQFETNKDVIAANALLMKKIRDSAMLGNKFWTDSDVSSIISSPTCPNQLSQASSVTETLSQHNEFILNHPFSPSSVNSTECTEDHFHENTSQDVKKFNKNPNINILAVDIIPSSIKQNRAKKDSKILGCDNKLKIVESNNKKDNLLDSSITFQSDNSYINDMLTNETVLEEQIDLLHSNIFDSSKNTNDITTNVEEGSMNESLVDNYNKNESLQSSSDEILEENLLGYDTKQNKWVSEIKRDPKQKFSRDTSTVKCINLDQSPARKKTSSPKKNQAEDNIEPSNSSASKFKKRKPKTISKLKSQIIRQMRAKRRMFQLQPPSISTGCDDSFLDKQTSLSNKETELNRVEDVPGDGELREESVRIEPTTESQEPGTQQEGSNDKRLASRRTRSSTLSESNSSCDVLSQIMGEMDKTLPPVYCSIAKSVKENSRSTKRRITMPEFKPYKKGITKRKSAKKRKKCRNKKARMKLTGNKEEPV
ncbi:unnamed protein product [Phyllotreta striolata]|uniref:Uncharacterized protein n=1 Tax=Phyllotreta striolata TaxID=444603 RepID=A0A9N9TX61_PHYSR|nr:unnamed protein product [Phyllotreta striolata]